MSTAVYNPTGWTYSGDPLTSPKDEVRFLISDTNPADPLLQDAEIRYQIALVYGSVDNAPAIGNYLPAAFAADGIAARYARQADKSVGDLHISHSNQFKQFQLLAQRLRARATNALVPPYSGGQSWGEKKSTYSNPDLIEPAIKIEGMTYVRGPRGVNNPANDPSVGP
jgi:hypothetical protein